jgi:hypothetical protein
MSTNLSTLHPPLRTHMLNTSNSHTLLSSTLLNTSSLTASPSPAPVPTDSLVLLPTDKRLRHLDLLRLRLVVSYLLAGSSSSISRASASSM